MIRLLRIVDLELAGIPDTSQFGVWVASDTTNSVIAAHQALGRRVGGTDTPMLIVNREILQDLRPAHLRVDFEEPPLSLPRHRHSTARAPAGYRAFAALAVASASWACLGSEQVAGKSPPSVMSEAPSFPGSRHWLVDSLPRLSIGGASVDDSRYQFSTLAGALRLSDGTIVVADRRASAVRFFSSGGQFLISVGRGGQGPGEFENIMRILPFRGDTILVTDSNGRLTFLTPAGAVASVMRPPGPPMQAVGAFADGSLMLVSAVPRSVPPSAAPRETSTTSLRIVSRQGDSLTTVSGLPNGIRARVAGQLVGMPFSPRGYYTAFDSGFYWGFPTAYEITMFDTRGEKRRVIARSWDPEPVTTSHRDAYQRRVLSNFAGTPGEPGAMRRAQNAVFPEHHPAFSMLVADRMGYLWVKDYENIDVNERPDRQPSSMVPWTVFDPDGRWFTTVLVPAALEVRDIGSDHIVGWTQDELGVLSVVEHRLARGPSALPKARVER